MSEIQFATIASGSKGNCIYIGTENTKILIDAGISGKKAEQGLSELGIKGEEIDAVFVTHEHNDHVDGVGILSRRYDIPIYATEGTWDNMPEKVGQIRENNRRAVYAGEMCAFNEFSIQPFNIPHDAAQPVGYRINAFGKTLTVATDIGHITDDVMQNCRDCDLLLLESNHDVGMVHNGPYPYPLKRRVLGDFGHLSNENCGKMITDICTSRLKYVVLGHLSGENNTPMLAYNTSKAIMQGVGIEIGDNGDVNMYVAAPFGVKRRITI
ncbi:MAG: MBL fold metallo-hydrolase [Firmicutes bacterium]|nr:MBL fold metallo-hydrolase [Bacillota bacterium]